MKKVHTLVFAVFIFAIQFGIQGYAETATILELREPVRCTNLFQRFGFSTPRYSFASGTKIEVKIPKDGPKIGLQSFGQQLGIKIDNDQTFGTTFEKPIDRIIYFELRVSYAGGYSGSRHFAVVQAGNYVYVYRLLEIIPYRDSALRTKYYSLEQEVIQIAGLQFSNPESYVAFHRVSHKTERGLENSIEPALLITSTNKIFLYKIQNDGVNLLSTSRSQSNVSDLNISEFTYDGSIGFASYGTRIVTSPGNETFILETDPLNLPTLIFFPGTNE